MRSRAFQDRVRPVLETIPGAKITFQEASSFSGAAASALTQLPIQINVRGNDLHAITQFAERLRDRLAGVPGLEDVNTNVRPARPEVQINVKRESAAQLGVSTTQVATVFRTFIGGDVVSKFRQGEKEIDIRLRLDERDRGRLDLLEGLSVPTVRGTTVMLSQVADVVFSAGPTQITRQNRARQIIVGGNIRQGRALGEVTADVQKVLSSMETPEGVVVTIGGQAEQMADSFKSLGVSLALAILFVYMVLASQFGSFLQPFTIMLALPLAVIGAFLALLLAGRPLDTMALIGLIMLMGLVTKNSILLIDYINRGRRGGLSRSEAIVEAGLKRLRPILMTSLAMILGMVPVAMAFGTSAEFRVSMGVTIIGGLISSTMLTLVVVPVVYTVLDDIVRRFRPAARPNLITE
jgi:HAE1 family hydrophobic/amphiphilic exporter-1